MKFRLFHLILETCKCSTAFLPVVASRVRIRSGYYPAIFLENSSIVPSWLHICIQNALILVLGIIYLSSMGHHAVFIFCFLDVHNSTAKPSSVCDYRYSSYGEFARFTYCLLQKLQVGTIFTPGRELGGVHASQQFAVPSF